MNSLFSKYYNSAIKSCTTRGFPGGNDCKPTILVLHFFYLKLLILGCSMFVGDTWSSTLFDCCFGNSHMTSYAIFDLYFVTGSSLNTWHRFPHFFILWPWIIRKFIKTCLFFTFLLSHFFFDAFRRCYDNDNLRDNLASTWHDCKRPRACFSQKNRAKVNPKVNL